jgi:hypothetical protein
VHETSHDTSQRFINNGLLGHSRKHPYLSHGGNWKLTPLPPSDVLIHLLLSETILSPLPLRTAEISSVGDCGSFLERPITSLMVSQYDCLIYIMFINFRKKHYNMFAWLGLKYTRFAVTTVSVFAKKSFIWSTALRNRQISSDILRQERKIILILIPCF